MADVYVIIRHWGDGYELQSWEIVSVHASKTIAEDKADELNQAAPSAYTSYEVQPHELVP